jgi:hypothetical protein
MRLANSVKPPAIVKMARLIVTVTSRRWRRDRKSRERTIWGSSASSGVSPTHECVQREVARAREYIAAGTPLWLQPCGCMRSSDRSRLVAVCPRCSGTWEHAEPEA